MVASLRRLLFPSSFVLGCASAFPEELYHAAEEPFRSYPCLPRRLHIAQANNVNGSKKEEHTVSVTVSFSLDFQKCRGARPFVLYGQGIRRDGAIAAADKPLQFNYSSWYTDSYQSDWIYHVVLPDLKAGLQSYWYRIIVQAADDDDVGDGSRGTYTSVERSLRGSTGYFLGETKSYRFRTPPLPGSPTTLALVGDLGQTHDSVKTMTSIWKASNERKNPVSQLL
jgi:hypothetical protein